MCYERSLNKFITSNGENIKYTTGNFGVKEMFGLFFSQATPNPRNSLK